MHAFKLHCSTETVKTPIRITFDKKERQKSESSQQDEEKEDQEENIPEVIGRLGLTYMGIVVMFLKVIGIGENVINISYFSVNFFNYI